jgi:DNA-binding transcriptional regulator YiaG
MVTHPLKAFRKQHEPPLSQGDLAAMLQVERETVARWESGVRKIRKERLPEIVRKTGIPARELRPDIAELVGE